MNAQINRRDFLKLMAVSTGGLVLAVYLDGCAPLTTPQPVTATQVPCHAHTPTARSNGRPISISKWTTWHPDGNRFPLRNGTRHPHCAGHAGRR